MSLHLSHQRTPRHTHTLTHTHVHSHTFGSEPSGVRWSINIRCIELNLKLNPERRGVALLPLASLAPLLLDPVAAWKKGQHRTRWEDLPQLGGG